MNNGNEPISPMYKVLQYGRHSSTGNTTHEPEGGLTKREYFAAMAMQGMLSNMYVHDFSVEINDDSYDMPHGLTNNALRYADALLEELEK